MLFLLPFSNELNGFLFFLALGRYFGGKRDYQKISSTALFSSSRDWQHSKFQVSQMSRPLEASVMGEDDLRAAMWREYLEFSNDPVSRLCRCHIIGAFAGVPKLPTGLLCNHISKKYLIVSRVVMASKCLLIILFYIGHVEEEQL